MVEYFIKKQKLVFPSVASEVFVIFGVLLVIGAEESEADVDRVGLSYSTFHD